MKKPTQLVSSIRRLYDFLDRPLFMSSRLAIALLCIPLAFSLVQPLWRISMEAPQYPRGLSVDIYAHRLVGGHDGEDIQEINTLNHYIGMHHLSDEEIPDLGWMPFAIGALLLLTLRVAAIGNVRMLVDHAMLTTYVLGFMAARFVYRMYVYGHDLDPRAPFTVDPFMPGILGTKQIANFTTHAGPLIGTYLMLAFAFGYFGLTAWHLVSGRRAYVREREAAKSAAPAELPAAPSAA